MGELVISGQLARWPANLRTIFQARDTSYGIFSICFVICITIGIPTDAEKKKEHRKALELRSANERRNQAEQVEREEVNSWILNELEKITDYGRKTAPTIPTLLDTLENTLMRPTRSNSLDIYCGPRPPDNRCNISDTKRKEIQRLGTLYAEWKPIYKWQGEHGAG